MAKEPVTTADLAEYEARILDIASSIRSVRKQMEADSTESVPAQMRTFVGALERLERYSVNLEHALRVSQSVRHTRKELDG